MSERTPKRYLSTSEAANYLGISAAKLEQLRVRGGGPSYSKLGRRVIYDIITDLDAWVLTAKRTITRDRDMTSTATEPAM
jgi:hypothetical protein